MEKIIGYKYSNKNFTYIQNPLKLCEYILSIIFRLLEEEEIKREGRGNKERGKRK